MQALAVDGAIDEAAFTGWWNEHFIGEEDARKEHEARLAQPPAELEGHVQSVMPEVQVEALAARFIANTVILYTLWTIFTLSASFSNVTAWALMFIISTLMALLLTYMHVPKVYEVLDDGLVVHGKISCTHFSLPFELMCFDQNDEHIAYREAVVHLSPSQAYREAWCSCMALAPNNTVQLKYKSNQSTVRTLACYPKDPERFVALIEGQVALARGRREEEGRRRQNLA